MPTLLQPSFAKGEISPSLYGRVDTAAYQVALRTARNLIIHSYGGASNRAGLMFVGPCAEHGYAPRLIDFQFKSTDTYVLEFGDFYMRVIRNDAHVTETPKNITGATQANPCVITSNAHGFANGDEVYISGVGGMTRLNGRRFIVAGVSANNFSLTDQVTGVGVNSTAFGAYTSGGTVARIYEIVTIYSKNDLSNLKYVQSADVMTFTHPSYPTQELSRTGHTAWSFSTPTFQPNLTHPTAVALTVNSAGAVTYRYQVTAIAGSTGEESLPGVNTAGAKTITGITQANPAVVTSAAHGFSNGDEVLIESVAGMTQVNDRRFVCTNVAANTFELYDNFGRKVDSTSYSAYTSGGTAKTTFVRTTLAAATADNTVSWTGVTGAESYNVYKETNGVFYFVGSSNTTSFRDTNITVDKSQGPPRYREVFRVAGDYPGTVSYFNQRRVFGGSNNEPDTSRYSQTGRPSNFTVSSPVEADDAITATLTSLRVNDIRHFVPGNDLIVLTSGAEWRVNSGTDSSFEAGTIKQKPQSNWGCAQHRPLVIGNTILFVRDNNAQVRSFGYSLQIDGYTGTDMNLLAGHIFETYTLTDWGAATSPDNTIHMVRSDGKALTMTFNQEQEVVAWATWDTLGKFERTTVLRKGPNQVEDNVYFVVRRVINGQVVRYIEKLHSRRFTDVRDAFFVDCGLTYDVPIAISGATAANPIVVTATAHGLANGDTVDISDIEWQPVFDEFDGSSQPDQLNGHRYTVANATANTFTLKNDAGADVSGVGFSPYVSGGYVRKAVTTFSGLDHLEGQAVAILADGNVAPDASIVNGSVTLTRKASRVQIGLKYVADLETLNIEAPQGTIQDRPRKIPACTIRFRNSRGLFYGTTFDDMDELKQREFETMGSPTTLLTGDRTVTMPSGWDLNGKVCLRQRYPLPVTILAVIPQMEIGDA